MEFNPQQLEVVNHRDGPCLVTAVPGSGKTASLTERVKRLIDSGIDPRNILAITFTNKAAKEMKLRISQKVGDSAKKVIVSTFHSLCARLLRRHPLHVGLNKNFTIMDSDDQKRLLQSCFCKVKDYEKKSEIDIKNFRIVFNYIEKTRNSCISDSEKKMLWESWMYDVVKEYYRALKLSNAVDFTGLLSNTLKLFDKYPEILEKYQEIWRYISVDEVQDTNISQYRLISLLANKYKNILVVGDLDQSIYKFRGASPENILRFEKDFNAKVLKLETNYRSTPQILTAAQKVIENNILRKETSLTTKNENGPIPIIVRSNTDSDMAYRASSYIQRRIRSGIKPSDIAILYRVNAASRILEQGLRMHKIKYKIIGDVSFFDRQEIKTSLFLMRLIANGNDRIAFERSIDYCCRGVGYKTLTKISELSASSKIKIVDAGRRFCLTGSSQSKKLKSFMDVYDVALKMEPSEGLLHIAKNSAFWKKISDKSDKKNDRCENVRELARDLKDFLSKSDKHDLSRYLQEISLVSSSDEESDNECINLMTFHAAKGLEFEVVVLSHAMQGIIPHIRAIESNDPSELEEERRLFYVGMTRAKKHLSIIFSSTKGDTECKPSSFLYETGLNIPY